MHQREGASAGRESSRLLGKDAAPVLHTCTLIFRQPSALSLIMVRYAPGPKDNFAAATHRLGVRGHHADSTEIVQDIFRCDGLCSDPRLGEADVFRDVLREVVACHSHIEVFFNGVRSVWACRVRAAR